MSSILECSRLNENNATGKIQSNVIVFIDRINAKMLRILQDG